MPKLSEKQVLVTTVLVPTLLIGGVGWLAWTDYQKIYAAEITDEHPEAAEVTDPEAWGERRKCQEIQKEMDTLRGEADLIAKREQDVIVYREIVQRDAQILPDKDQVNQLTNTIDDFARQAGVMVTSLGDLNLAGNPGQAISRVPIRLSLSGSYDQFLKFVNLFETMPRIVNTRSFSIQTGARVVDDPNVAPTHAIALELETYVYAAAAGLSKPVEIANYERRKDDQVIQKLVRQQKAARVDSYQLRPRINRRDPLVDPRKSQVDPAAGGVGVEQYDQMKRKIDKLRQDVTLLTEDVRLMNQYLQEKKYLQYVGMKQNVQDKVQALESDVKEADPTIIVPELREVFVEEVVTPFQKLSVDVLKGEGGSSGGVVVILRQHVKEFLDKQTATLESRDYEASVRTKAELDGLLARANHKLAEDAQDFVAQIQENARVATVMIEFDRLNLRVTGVIRQEQGSIVIINGKTRRVGDYVDDKNRCKLVAIKDDVLAFDLDGYEIEHKLEKK